MEIDNLSSATKFFMQNPADPLPEKPWNQKTIGNKKD